MSPKFNRAFYEYLSLTRLNKPIGITLLLWPTLWALWLSAQGIPSLKLLLIFVIGTVLTRSAGCIINDFADRDFDPHVQRTRERPLAARHLSPYNALVLFFILMLMAFLMALQLDKKTLFLSVFAALIMIIYPYCKRFFPAPQLFLGIAFGWAVPMVFMASVREVPRLGWLLFVITIIWTMIYDTLYAMVDIKDDRRIGLRSTAILFGDRDLFAIGVLQTIMILGLWLAGKLAGLSHAYHIGLAMAAALFVYQQWLARARIPALCFKAFLNNNFVGLSIFFGIAADYVGR
ncbi:MAG: 4-hydroxybenzoate octaprenyltransferase [Gammaproteobacteria bacterium]|nr:4-hydroxybenzoate octaprenyltransferase [Gammaproteobacteria bacterium]